MSDRQITKALVIKIKNQVPSTPEGKLMFAIFEQAVDDLTILSRPAHRGKLQAVENYYTAIAYFRDGLPGLEHLDIEADWIFHLFRQAGVDHLYDNDVILPPDIFTSEVTQ